MRKSRKPRSREPGLMWLMNSYGETGNQRGHIPRSKRRKPSRCAANRSYLAENRGLVSSKPPLASSKFPPARVKSPRARAKSPRPRAKFLQARAKPPHACTKFLQVCAENLQADTDIVQARAESRAHAVAAAARRRSEVAAVGERPLATHCDAALRRCEPALRRGAAVGTTLAADGSLRRRRARLQHEAAALRQGEQEAPAGGVAAVARRRARDH